MGENAGVEQPVQQAPEAPPQEPVSPYAEHLESLPESVRPLVEPIFKKWDADVTQRFQQVHSQYEPYKAWEPIASEYDPDTVQQAIQLAQVLNEDPRRVYDALAENFGYASEQGHADPDAEDDSEFDGPVIDPRLQTVEEMTNAMAEIMLSQQRIQQEAQEDAELDAYLNDLKSKHGDYDEEYVLAHMHMGFSGEEAIAKYQQLIGQARQTAPVAPAILGSGGGLPSNAIDPAQLSTKDTKALVAQFLAQANNQGG